jgi:hypothetical protein
VQFLAQPGNVVRLPEEHLSNKEDLEEAETVEN